MLAERSKDLVIFMVSLISPSGVPMHGDFLLLFVDKFHSSRSVLSFVSSDAYTRIHDHQAICQMTLDRLEGKR